MKTRVFLISIVMIVGVQQCFAVELTRVFTTQDSFTMHLSDEWVEIPSEILKQYMEVMRQLAPNAPEQTYDYGYQRQPFDTWLMHPYILVQVRKTGRIPEGELKRYKQINEGLREGMKQMEQELTDFVSQVRQGETIYDPIHHILWSNISMNVENVGNIKALLAVKLTEFGYIQVNMYATEDTFNTYSSIFKQIATSMILDPEIEYKPQIADSFPVIGGINTGKVLIGAIYGTILGGIGGLVVYLLRGKTRASDDKRERIGDESW